MGTKRPSMLSKLFFSIGGRSTPWSVAVLANGPASERFLLPERDSQSFVVVRGGLVLFFFFAGEDSLVLSMTILAASAYL
jgi:hypothetical protein